MPDEHHRAHQKRVTGQHTPSRVEKHRLENWETAGREGGRAACQQASWQVGRQTILVAGRLVGSLRAHRTLRHARE